MQPIYKNGLFYCYYRKNISRRVSKAVLRPSITASWTPREYCIGQRASVMELHWDYDYYQPWTDNKWIVEEMMAVKDKEDKDDIINDVPVHQDQVRLQT